MNLRVLLRRDNLSIGNSEIGSGESLGRGAVEYDLPIVVAEIEVSFAIWVSSLFKQCTHMRWTSSLSCQQQRWCFATHLN